MQVIQDPLAPVTAIDNVTKDSLIAAAKSLNPSSKTFSLVAIGGTSELPYLDDIFVIWLHGQEHFSEFLILQLTYL